MWSIETDPKRKKKPSPLQFGSLPEAPEGGLAKGKAVKVPPGLGKDAYPDIKEPTKVTNTRATYNTTIQITPNTNAPGRLPPSNNNPPPGRNPTPGRLPPRNVPQDDDDDDGGNDAPPPTRVPPTVSRTPPTRTPPNNNNPPGRNPPPGRLPPRNLPQTDDNNNSNTSTGTTPGRLPPGRIGMPLPGIRGPGRVPPPL